ncbi:MAG: hypothetical protein FJX46_08355 [Alphaproteobacteria bacterium]|nr:hypothetical protein [Alphaproteobacteria bacterium]
MERRHIFMATVAVAVANGIFTPYLSILVAFSPMWYPTWLPGEASYLFMLASLLASTTTLMLAGIPATLIERSFPDLAKHDAELWAWLGFTVLLSFDGLMRMLGYLVS